VKCVDIIWNAKGEVSELGFAWHWDTKAWVANGIRYPGSPRPKRCQLGLGSIDPFRTVANALSWPPGKYERKLKTQRNRRGPAQAVEHAVQFVNKRGTSPGLEILLQIPRNRDFFESVGQVLHGCRQLVPWGVPLSRETSATPVECYLCHSRLPAPPIRSENLNYLLVKIIVVDYIF